MDLRVASLLKICNSTLNKLTQKRSFRLLKFSAFNLLSEYLSLLGFGGQNLNGKCGGKVGNEV